MSPVKGPEFVRFMGPVIDALKSLGGSGRPAEVREIIAQSMEMSEEKKAELMSGGGPRFDNQVHWARFYLAKAGYIESSKRGVWSLTDKGRGISKLAFTDALILFKQVHKDFGGSHRETDEPHIDSPESGLDGGDDGIEEEHDYRLELLSLLLSLPPKGFENLCRRLLLESGFEKAEVTGRSGDGGIDGHGVLLLNPFVSFKVLFQCKRYAGSVTASQVRDFRRAMMGRADKGIILTTGTFTSDAQKEALRDGVTPIELVNGEKLLDMFEHLELGLTPRRTYDLDRRFFAEFQTEDKLS